MLCLPIEASWLLLTIHAFGLSTFVASLWTLLYMRIHKRLELFGHDSNMLFFLGYNILDSGLTFSVNIVKLQSSGITCRLKQDIMSCVRSAVKLCAQILNLYDCWLCIILLYEHRELNHTKYSCTKIFHVYANPSRTSLKIHFGTAP